MDGDSSDESSLCEPLNELVKSSITGEDLVKERFQGENSSFSLFKEIYFLFLQAWPMSMATLCRNSLVFIDCAFIGHMDQSGNNNYLSSAVLGATCLNILYAPIWGLGTSLNTLCSQSIGYGDHRQVGQWLHIAQVSLICISVPLILIVSFVTGPLLYLLGFEEAVVANCVKFVSIMSLHLIPLSQYIAVRQFAQCIGIVWPATITAIFAIGVDIGLNYLFIYGIPGQWSGLGFVGSPLATVCTGVFQLFAFCIYVFFWKQLHLDYFPEAFFLSLAEAADSLGYEAMSIASGKLSTTIVAAQGICFQLWSMSWSLLWGILLSSQVRIGNWIGANRPERAKKTAWVCFLMTSVIALCITVIVSAAHSSVGRLFTDDEAILEQVSRASWVFAIAFSLSSVTCTLSAIFEGIGEPRFMVPIFIVSSWLVLLPSAYLYAFVLKQGIQGLWFGSASCEFTKVVCLGAVLFCKINWEDASRNAIERCSEKSEKIGVLEASPHLSCKLDEPDNGISSAHFERLEYSPLFF